MNEQALRKYFEGAATRDFRLGHFDCVRFVAEALYIGWGKDYRGELDYWDRRSAVRRLRKAGGLLDAVTGVLGDPVNVERMQVGDVVYMHDPRPTIGLVMPTYVAVKRGQAIDRMVFSFDYGFKS